MVLPAIEPLPGRRAGKLGEVCGKSEGGWGKFGGSLGKVEWRVRKVGGG